VEIGHTHGHDGLTEKGNKQELDGMDDRLIGARLK
jgi:hypothetical protein